MQKMDGFTRRILIRRKLYNEGGTSATAAQGHGRKTNSGAESNVTGRQINVGQACDLAKPHLKPRVRI